MSLLREISEGLPAPSVPEEGWNVGHLAHNGILLSCEGFSVKLDLDQLNVLFDYAEDGEGGEIRDHDNSVVYVEVADNSIVLTRDGDKNYPNGVVLDAKTLKEMGIEAHEDAESTGEEQPTDDEDDEADDDTMASEVEEEPVEGDVAATEDEPEEELEEGVKRAYRRVGKKIKKGFRVTSGWRKGRIVSSPKGAYKKRPKAKTRMKLRIAAKRRKVVRILKSKRTRKRSVSKRLVAMNKRLK